MHHGSTLVLAVLTTSAVGCGVTPYVETPVPAVSVTDGGNPQANAPTAATVDDGGAPPPSAADADTCTTTVLARPGTVITRTGAVTGVRAGSTWAFKGIPYVMPPVGALRWKPPAPVACWHDERQTTSFGPSCPQRDGNGDVVGDEDCLYLNVWAPDDAAGAPVLVFIHGGGNTQGSASETLYDGEALATRTHSIVVTFDYRLGALGFFAHPDLDKESATSTSGNYGILDQIAALRWVQANIGAFGGSPAHVLLFGESAGGQDTLVHVASPLSKGLFSAALVESGGVYKTTLAEAETDLLSVVSGVGCDAATDVIGCMRATKADALAGVASALGPLEKGMRYVPVIDGQVLKASSLDTIVAGTHNHVPLILGTNAEETGKMVPAVTTAAEYAYAVISLYGKALGFLLLTQYPAAAYATPRQALIHLTTDATWTCPARKIARAAALHQSEPVFRYHFTWKPSGLTGAVYGAFHGLELPFVFDNLAIFAAAYTPTTADQDLAGGLQGYWGRFAATGDPNGGGATIWPRYDADADPYLALDTAVSANAALIASQCDFIDALAP
jgi:para-nitrobenzyl esterase